MRKVYKKLTEEQYNRGVIFSSQLQPDGSLHEVTNNTQDKDIVIARLLNDKFFNQSGFKYNEVHRGTPTIIMNKLRKETEDNRLKRELR